MRWHIVVLIATVQLQHTRFVKNRVVPIYEKIHKEYVHGMANLCSGRGV